MPKRKVVALQSVKKKLRSKVPVRRPRSSHLYSFLNDFTSASSTSNLLRCDEPLLSVDDSSRVTIDVHCLFPSSSSGSGRVVNVTDYGPKSFSNHTAVAAPDVVSESSSCVESCSVVGESSADGVFYDWKQIGLFSTLHRPATFEFDVTSQEQQPLFYDHQVLKSETTVDDDYDGVSIVDEGGLASLTPASFIDVLDCSSSEQDDADFSPSIYLDSGTDFSERSVGDSAPSLTYSYLLQYRLVFQRSFASPAAEDVHSHHGTTEVSITIVLQSTSYSSSVLCMIIWCV